MLFEDCVEPYKKRFGFSLSLWFAQLYNDMTTLSATCVPVTDASLYSNSGFNKNRCNYYSRFRKPWRNAISIFFFLAGVFSVPSSSEITCGLGTSRVDFAFSPKLEPLPRPWGGFHTRQGSPTKKHPTKPHTPKQTHHNLIFSTK